MRASLASATSVLALLLVQVRGADATPFVPAGAGVTFGDAAESSATDPQSDAAALTGDAAAGSRAGGSAAGTFGQTPESNFASSMATPSGTASYYTIGLAMTGNATLPVVDLSNVMSIPRGASSPGHSVFVGTAAELALREGLAGAASASSASFGYSFTPTANTDADAPPGVIGLEPAPADTNASSGGGNSIFATIGAVFTPNPPNAAPGWWAAESQGYGRINRSAGGAASAAGYAYTPNNRASASGDRGPAATSPSRPEQTAPTGGPGAAASLAGTGGANAPIQLDRGATGLSVLDFAPSGLGASNAPDPRNLLDYLNRGAPDLAVADYTISAADASSPGTASLPAPSVIPAGGILMMPMIVIPDDVGELAFGQTNFIEVGTGLSGGRPFTLLDPAVVALLMSPPELVSLAVLGAGLAGLASVWFRRARRPE